jgi:hypothetical protein
MHRYGAIFTRKREIHTVFTGGRLSICNGRLLARCSLWLDTFAMINQRKLSRLFVFVASISLVGASFVAPANAAPKSKNLSASNLVTISYPLLVTIPRNGCGKIPVKYKINQLPIDESAFYVVIEDNQNRLIGQEIWYGTNYEGSVKAMPKSGILNIKVCRDMWTDPEEENTFYPVYKGTYSILLSAVGDMSADAKASLKLA